MCRPWLPVLFAAAFRSILAPSARVHWRGASYPGKQPSRSAYLGQVRFGVSSSAGASGVPLALTVAVAVAVPHARRMTARARRSRMRLPKMSTARISEAPDVFIDEGVLDRRIFCNRELNMKQIEAVGFDLDYTLAEYNTDFELLAFDGAIQKLLGMGFPRT